MELLSWDLIFSSNGWTLSPLLKRLYLEILPIKNQLHAVKFLTSSFPLLQTLCIRSRYIPPNAQFDEESRPDSKLHVDNVSPISKLRTVKVEGFQGRDCEVELVTYFLATSTVLEEMNICYTKEMGSNDKTRVFEVLSGLPRVSPRVTLSIC
ncbi:hypothetical protein ACHQM5_021261 [Ranunculus cassubicifolius]